MGNGTADEVRRARAEPARSTGTKDRTDGYIFGMIRNGRGLMPTYNRIEEMDRWDVVNYVRALQGKIPGVDGRHVAGRIPGQTDRSVPGYTRTAPTRPAPYRPQDMAARMSRARGHGGAAGTAPAPSDSASTAKPQAAPKPEHRP